MNARNFLKPKKFNIKAKSISFESVRFMTDLEKKKVYINFVSFLNNHFSYTTFKKNLYEHFHLHCGFIAHYNINGFYGEYFETAASFHYNVNGVNHKVHECGGNLNCKSGLSQGEQFYAIYEELNGSRNGLGDFYGTIINNRNYGGYDDYRDLDNAIREAFGEYLEIWREEIKKAIQAYDQFSKNEEIQKLQIEQAEILNEQKCLEETAKQIEETLVNEASKVEVIKEEPIVTAIKTCKHLIQPSLFDFMVA